MTRVDVEFLGGCLHAEHKHLPVDGGPIAAAPPQPLPMWDPDADLLTGPTMPRPERHVYYRLEYAIVLDHHCVRDATVQLHWHAAVLSSDDPEWYRHRATRGDWCRCPWPGRRPNPWPMW